MDVKANFKVEGVSGEQLAKRMFWLAWKACGGALGMGFLQDNPGANEEAVWKNVMTAGDYAGGQFMKTPSGKPYGDYVFGRMMKMGVDFVEDGIVLPTPDRDKPRHDYQAWCSKYRTQHELAKEAAKTFQGKVTDDLDIVIPAAQEVVDARGAVA